MLESQNKPDNCFVTLTFSENNLPSDGSVNPRHLSDFVKRLRADLPPRSIRYYGVGEYGDETFRPHYHVILFGYPNCRRGRTDLRKRTCCDVCELVRRKWGHGEVFLGSVDTNSAQYVCGYVTKKMTSKNDVRLAGRHPEFARMSLKPGIGADSLHDVASVLLALDLEQTEVDVPSSLRHGSRVLPLGRYLHRRLRLLVGRDPSTPPEVLLELQKKMLPLLEAARQSSETPSVKAQLALKNKGRMAQVKARSKLYKQRKSL